MRRYILFECRTDCSRFHIRRIDTIHINMNDPLLRKRAPEIWKVKISSLYSSCICYFLKEKEKRGKKTDFFSPCILNKVELGVSEHTQEERVYQKLYVNIVERENNWARNWRLENWLQNGFNILCSLTKRQTGFLLTVGPWPHYSCSISFRKLLIIIFFSAPWRRKSSPNLYQFNQPDMPFLESRKPSLWNIILKKDRVPIPPSSWESRSLSLISRN